MVDLFDNIILCKSCEKQMDKESSIKNGFNLRYAICNTCGKKEYHPLDIEKYKDFQQIRQKPFKVKLRLVGNSYAVSIPKEIINFFSEAENIAQEVSMRISEFDKLMLDFDQKLFKKNRFL